jgi:hypothetical protein
MTSTFDTSAEPLTRTKARKQAAKDAREQERQKLREAKRELRDSRYEIEHFPIAGGAAGVEFWQNFLALHAEHGKEGQVELYWGLMVRWDQFQLGRGGFPCPNDLRPTGSPRPSVTHQQVASVLDRAARHPLTVKAETVLQAAQLS